MYGQLQTKSTWFPELPQCSYMKMANQIAWKAKENYWSYSKLRVFSDGKISTYEQNMRWVSLTRQERIVCNQYVHSERMKQCGCDLRRKLSQNRLLPYSLQPQTNITDAFLFLHTPTHINSVKEAYDDSRRYSHMFLWGQWVVVWILRSVQW